MEGGDAKMKTCKNFGSFMHQSFVSTTPPLMGMGRDHFSLFRALL